MAGRVDEDGDGAGPSNAAPEPIESDASGSEFAPDAAQDAQDDKDDDMEADADGDYDYDEDADADASASVAQPKPRRTASTRELSFAGAESISVAPRRRGGAPKTTSRRSLPTVAGSTAASAKQAASQVLPNYNHRHRSPALHRRSGKAERLTKEPSPLSVGEIALTTAWGDSDLVADRVQKSWGCNIGPGPIWELVEDRAWFKEAFNTPRTTERDLRPRVHASVPLGDYELLNEQQAAQYPPHDTSVSSGSGIKPLPPVVCSFGPFGKQTRKAVQTLESVKISQFFPSSKAHVFHAGGPVWGLDWCPIHPDDRDHYQYRQYLAAAPFPSPNYSPKIGARIQRPSPACIQIWSLGPSAAEDAMDVDEGGPGTSSDDSGEMRCEMVLCIDSGPAFELKWCPLPSNDSTEDQKSPRKLGILAGTFQDGSLTFYAVPDPTTLERPAEQPEGVPLYVKLSKPLLHIELEETCFWSLDWANSEVVAVGCTNGTIAVYNVAAALRMDFAQPLLPTHFFTAHQSAIRSLAWVRAPAYSAQGEETADDPTVIVSGGYDGVECATDIRDMNSVVLNRTRDAVTTMCFSTYTGCAMTIDHETMIKAYSLSPTMLGRGHTILEPNGPVWCLAASDHHPQLAIGVTDGSCLTTNTLKSTRRGGLVPPLEHKIYQLDYSRTLGEYRMLEQFLPKETSTHRLKNAPAPSAPPTAAWPHGVGVQRTTWNDGNGPARAGLLASATGAGLCRVDWLRGRWARDPPPYSGVAGIRAETGGRFAEDDESE